MAENTDRLVRLLAWLPSLLFTGEATRRFGEIRANLAREGTPIGPYDLRAIRVRLELGKRVRDLALFNRAIDSKLRGCDLVGLRVGDVSRDHVVARATVIQHKTGRPVRFELTGQTRETVGVWITSQHLTSGSFLAVHLYPQDRSRPMLSRDIPISPLR